jgi:hypothetical protein
MLKLRCGGVKLHANCAIRPQRDTMKLKSMLVGLAIALGLAAGSAHSQILQNLENAITGNQPS